MTGHKATTLGLLALVLAALPCSAIAKERRWISAWGSAQMRADDNDTAKIAKAGPTTIRQTVHLSAGGRSIRVRLSNVASTTPLKIGAASIGRGVPASATVSAVHSLTFGGATSIVVPAGAEIYSDPVSDFIVSSGSDVSVSLYFPETTTRLTSHPGARATTFLVPGDAAGRLELAQAQRIGGWWALADVEVDGGEQSGSIVAIGDSITDGHGVRDDSNARWPDVLARRLAANPATRALSIVNAGIGGNRVLLDGLGPNLLARFDRDVITRPSVRFAIVFEGVNDLGVLTRDHPATPEQHRAIVASITEAYRQLAERAHSHGIRLIAGTITPFVGSEYYHPGPETEADRQAINTFVRDSGTFDGVVDFDRIVRDPAHRDRLLPVYDSGDHLHPGEAGYAAMANAIPLSLFTTPAHVLARDHQRSGRSKD